MEIYYQDEEMDTSEGWKVVIISVQTELAYIYRDQKVLMPSLIHPSTSVADPKFFVLSSISESWGSLLKFNDLSPWYPHPHMPLQIVQTKISYERLGLHLNYWCFSTWVTGRTETYSCRLIFAVACILWSPRLGNWELVYMLFVHLFVYVTRVNNFCPFFSSSSWHGLARLVIVALPGCLYH